MVFPSQSKSGDVGVIPFHKNLKTWLCQLTWGPRWKNFTLEVVDQLLAIPTSPFLLFWFICQQHSKYTYLIYFGIPHVWDTSCILGYLIYFFTINLLFDLQRGEISNSSFIVQIYFLYWILSFCSKETKLNYQ